MQALFGAGAIEIEIEKPADTLVGRQTSSEGVSSNKSSVLQDSEANSASDPTQHPIKPYTEESYFYRYRRHLKSLKVTDFTTPTW